MNLLYIPSLDSSKLTNSPSYRHTSLKIYFVNRKAIAKLALDITNPAKPNSQPPPLSQPQNSIKNSCHENQVSDLSAMCFFATATILLLFLSVSATMLLGKCNRQYNKK